MAPGRWGDPPKLPPLPPPPLGLPAMPSPPTCPQEHLGGSGAQKSIGEVLGVCTGSMRVSGVFGGALRLRKGFGTCTQSAGSRECLGGHCVSIEHLEEIHGILGGDSRSVGERYWGSRKGFGGTLGLWMVFNGPGICGMFWGPRTALEGVCGDKEVCRGAWGFIGHIGAGSPQTRGSGAHLSSSPSHGRRGTGGFWCPSAPQGHGGRQKLPLSPQKSLLPRLPLAAGSAALYSLPGLQLPKGRGAPWDADRAGTAVPVMPRGPWESPQSRGCPLRIVPAAPQVLPRTLSAPRGPAAPSLTLQRETARENLMRKLLGKMCWRGVSPSGTAPGLQGSVCSGTCSISSPRELLKEEG
ncbi:uncharacterized protein LOC121339051 isoform X7 [Onychostruthus taczanowskii]|uniref:uncharacterized protein LOC121339051 isoform X7 n=1 Tax=Onychostruthus taczanowskii TaxID=356909 RepID=UPI001B8013A2|nr:uncharacterized protein LOC121339051 isoform X7 [Onychostruthus taczanowskii]